MTDATSNLSASTRAQRAIARAEAAMTRVDSQGRPLGPPAVFTYDDATGLLVSAEPGDDGTKPAA
ncbi:MAG: hypothetical protein ACXVXP_09780 [Mycobacteriaceae bacterium]